MDMAHLYVFSREDAQRVFVDVTHATKTSTYPLAELEQYQYQQHHDNNDSLMLMSSEMRYMRNLVMHQYTCADKNVKFYTCTLDTTGMQSVPGVQYHVYTQCGRLVHILRQASIHIDSVNIIMGACGPRIEQVLSMLHPIELDHEKIARLKEATGLRSYADDDAQRMRQQRTRERRRRHATSRVRQRDDVDIDLARMNGGGGTSVVSPGRRVRARRNPPPPFMDAMFGDSAIRTYNGTDGIMIDMSRPPPTEPLPESPVEPTGMSLSDDWEALLKADEDLHQPTEKRYLCGACCTYEKTVITLPCRHMYYCDQCFRRHMSSNTLHKTCTQCRAPITGIVRAYND